MAMLFFDRKYKFKIESGEKTTTIRCWKRKMVEAGSRVKTNLGFELDIQSIEPFTLNQIDDALAKRDGFTTADELRNAVVTRNAGKTGEYYLVTFSRVPHR